MNLPFTKYRSQSLRHLTLKASDSGADEDEPLARPDELSSYGLLLAKLESYPTVVEPETFDHLQQKTLLAIRLRDIRE